ncbi:hypothetical protein Tco_0271495 [Tanacetum coccineum]
MNTLRCFAIQHRRLGSEPFNSLGHVKIVNEILDNSDDEAEVAESMRAQDEYEGSPRNETRARKVLVLECEPYDPAAILPPPRSHLL